MVFELVIPRQRIKSELKLSFNKNKNTIYANIYISDDFLSSLNWKMVKKIKIYIDKEEPRKWMLKSCEDNDKNGFKIIRPNKKYAHKIQFKFNYFLISEEEFKIRAINFEVIDGNIILTV